MLSTRVRNGLGRLARRSTPALVAGCLLGAGASAQAQAPALPPMTFGAGMQTSFVHTSPTGGGSTDVLGLNSVRLYVNGTSADKIKFTFNTEYDGGTNKIGVLDAVARVEVSDHFNVWMGRFLPPSDRANLYGPYYSHEWAVYTDGIQDGYPFVATGRDNGVAYWGQFGKVKVQGGAFDGASATGVSKIIGAGRVMVDLWDPEPGYYLNGTFYGGKNILAIGAAGQVQDGNTAATADFLLERKLPRGAGFSIESEYANYSQLGGYDARYAKSDGGYALASYLFPGQMGVGKLELLGKFAHAAFSKGLSIADPDYNQKTTEINVNYIIKEFNARLMFFIKDTRFSAVKTNDTQVGVGFQLQM